LCGHGVFRGLVPSRRCTEVRDAIRLLPGDGWQQIFNAKNQNQSGRQMAQAPPVGQGVVNEVFAFLQTRALIATKWHRLDLARHAVVLGNMTRLQRQAPHTDFEITEFADFSPEIRYSQSFSLMVVLQPTKVYFRNVAGVLIPEHMNAGDVLCFAGMPCIVAQNGRKKTNYKLSKSSEMVLTSGCSVTCRRGGR
jgi:hypothetical protein